MSHAVSSQPALPTCLAMSADTMKMPDPIIEPTTTIVASYRPSPRVNSVSRAVGDAVARVSDMNVWLTAQGSGLRVRGQARGRP